MRMKPGSSGILGMGVFLGLAGVAFVGAALYLTTDHYHTGIFTLFGLSCLPGAAVLIWRAFR